MTPYKGEVIATNDDDFPFAAVISDEAGNVIGEFLVRTAADGEAKIREVLKDLEVQQASGREED